MKNIIKQLLVTVFMVGSFSALQASAPVRDVVIRNDTEYSLLAVDTDGYTGEILGGTEVRIPLARLDCIMYRGNCIPMAMQWARKALCDCLIQSISGTVVRTMARENSGRTLIISKSPGGCLIIQAEGSLFGRAAQKFASMASTVCSAVSDVANDPAVNGILEVGMAVAPRLQSMRESDAPLGLKAVQAVAAVRKGAQAYPRGADGATLERLYGVLAEIESEMPASVAPSRASNAKTEKTD